MIDMPKARKVIIIPGLGDGTGMIRLATRHWSKFGLEPIIWPIGWRSKEKEFEPKLKRLVELIDRFSQAGDSVSLVGTSAGGSAAINAFIERKDVVRRVVNVCGRLRIGSNHGFRSFEARTASSVAFAQSVKLCELKELSLSQTDRLRVMTVRAMFGDELVPADTATLRGACNITIPVIGHMFSIGMALTLFSRPVIKFLSGSE